MFVTYFSAAVSLPEIFGRTGVRHWRVIERNVHCAWFHLEVVELGSERSTMYLLDSVLDVEQVVSELPDRFRIKEAQIVSPRRMNNLGRWAMEPLLEISELIDERDGAVGYKYTVERGDSYLDPAPETPPQFVKTRTIFSAA
jgi:hypothetical protein